MVNFQILSKTALYFAAEQGSEKLIKLFLDKNADITVQNWFGDTATHIAANKGHTAIVQLLVQHSKTYGIPLHDSDSQPSSVRCDKCHSRVIKPSTYYHCYICDDSDFDLCQSCIDSGEHCHVADHHLIRLC